MTETPRIEYECAHCHKTAMLPVDWMTNCKNNGGWRWRSMGPGIALVLACSLDCALVLSGKMEEQK